MEKSIESRDQALHRLAQQARDRGVHIMKYVPTNEYFATSVSQPEKLHRVTAWSCDCRAFQTHQRCTHFAALLAAIGELPDLDPEPTPLSTTQGIVTFNGDALRRVNVARAEVVRLSRNPKSTADWFRLQNAQAQLNELVTVVGPRAAAA